MINTIYLKTKKKNKKETKKKTKAKANQISLNFQQKTNKVKFQQKKKPYLKK